MVTNLGGDDLTSVINSNGDPWQQAMARWHTVPASHVAQAAEVIRGLAGSWAASYQFDYGVKNENRSLDSKVGNPSQVKTSLLGHPGFPEINFAPYNAGTNRFGPKGGSFIGNPISFEVVGPTAKDTEFSDTYWDVDPVTNELAFSSGDIDVVFGVSMADFTTYYPGGLYVVITQTGSPGALTTQAGVGLVGGLGDGCDPSLAAKNGIPPLTPHSKYEIFRVIGIRTNVLELDSAKLLSSYFDTTVADPIVQSIMLIQPKATRLVAVPGSGKSTRLQASATYYNVPTVFAVVPPKRASLQDDQYRFDTWTGAAWNENNLPQYTLATGTEFNYKYGPSVPIPRPTSYWKGRLRGITPATGVLEAPIACAAGLFVLHPDAVDPGVTPPASLVGKILHINNVQSRNGAEMQPDTTATLSDFKRDFTSLMGWFEVVGWNAGGGNPYILVRRVSETDPSTGFPVIGSATWYMTDSTVLAAFKAIEVQATVHDPIEALWTTTYPDIDTIQSARLTNLIDPRWTERSSKTSGTSPNMAGISSARADRAVFDTSSADGGADGSNADPGSLLDLGFRMVLFPAKMGVEKDPAGGADLDVVVPDWDNPITSNEVVLDRYNPQVKQYIEVDYANGLVRLSQAPVLDASDLTRNYVTTFASADNPRHEVVLFACCVPYTQEEGQLSAGGVRVLGGQSFAADAASCADIGASDATDVFSGRIVVAVDPTSGAAGIVASVNHVAAAQSVFLQGDWTYKIPPSGFFELISGTSANDPPAIGDTYYRGSMFGYTAVDIDVGRTLTELKNVYGGGEYGVATVNTNNPTVAVFRREVVTPNDTTGKAGVSYTYDTTYGSAKRTPVLRFDGSDVLANVDGTVTIKSRATEATGNFDNLFSSWVLESNSITRTITAGVRVLVTVQPHVILMRGRRLTVPVSVVSITADGTYYIYYEHNDGTTCPQCLSTTSFPLPHPEDILLAKVVVSGVITVAVLTVLQNPLKDVDRRVDLYVGEIGGTAGDWATFQPHFRNLYEAVEYANEMMNPESGGRAYQNVRIRVIGRTQEPTSRLPIIIKTDGLVIEGNPFYDSDPTVAVTSEISWGANPNITDLIDLNGHSDLVFRNISFRSNQINNAVGGSAIFTCSSGSPSRITIDNCRSVGFIRYFVKLSDVDNAGEFRITDNVIGDLFSNPVGGNALAVVADQAGVNLPMPSIQNFVIRGNKFSSDPTAGRSGACIQITPATSPITTFMDTLQTNDNILIQDNIFTDFDTSIWATTQSGEISNNWVIRTAHEGVNTCGGWLIQNNHLVDVHRSLPSNLFTTYRTGILHYTYQREAGGAFDQALFSGRILHNRVELDFDANLDVANDKGIYVLGSPNTNDSFTLLENLFAQVGGGVDEIVLNAASIGLGIDSFFIGCKIEILAGMGVGEFGMITAYNGTTNTATVDFLWVAHPDATSEYRIDRLNLGSGEIVEGNYAGYTTGGQALLDMSNIRVHASDAKVDKNTCNILEIWGGDSNITGNTVAKMGVNYDITAAVPNPDRAYDDTNIVSNNWVDQGFHPWAGTRIIGNHFMEDVNFQDGNRCVISDNTFKYSLTIGTGISSNSFTISGNRIGIGGLVLGSAGFPVGSATITGNQVTDTGIATWSNTTNYTGNNLKKPDLTYGTFTIVGASNVVSGNITGALSSTGLYNMITGNQLFNDLTVVTVSGFTVLGQNSVGGDILINSDYIMVTGNVVNNDISFATDGLTNGVVNGNMVSGSILLGSNAAGQVDPVVIVGNMVGGATGISGFGAKPAVPSAIVVANAAQFVFTAAAVAANANANNQNI